jgi:hypothetical protein
LVAWSETFIRWQCTFSHASGQTTSQPASHGLEHNNRLEIPQQFFSAIMSSLYLRKLCKWPWT